MSCNLESMCRAQRTLLTQTLESNYKDGKFSELSQGIGDYVYRVPQNLCHKLFWVFPTYN